MATETNVPDGGERSTHAVVFGLFPGNATYFTVVERAPEVGGAPGTPTKVAWLNPGVRHYIEYRNPTTTFSYYRFRHAGFGAGFGTPTAWYRARPRSWNGEVPNIPREPLLDLDLSLDDSDGTVDLVANGGRRVASIVYSIVTTGYGTTPATSVDTDAEGDVTVADAITLTGGQTAYATVEFYDQVSGGGNLLGTLRQSVTRPIGVGESGALVLNGDLEADVDGKYWTDAVGSGSVAIESTSPLSGSKSLKITSATGGSTTVYQSNASSGFVTNSTSTRRLIQVEPGESFELRATGQGYSGQPLKLEVSQFDADVASAGPQSVVEYTNTVALAAIVAYTVPDGVRYIRWRLSVDADASGPRDFLFDNFSARRIDSEVTGIPSGISKGGIHHIRADEVTVDSSGGSEGSDPGHIYWGNSSWRYVLPDGTEVTVPADVVTYVGDGEDRTTARVLAYVGTNEGRFGDLVDEDMRKIVGVRKHRSKGWQYMGDTGWNDFTSRQQDVLIAEPVLTLED